MTTTTRQVLTIAAIAAASLLSAGAAFAQEATPDTWLQVQSTKSRADVSAELVAARQSGLTKAWSAGYMEPLRASALRLDRERGKLVDHRADPIHRPSGAHAKNCGRLHRLQPPHAAT